MSHTPGSGPHNRASNRDDQHDHNDNAGTGRTVLPDLWSGMDLSGTDLNPNFGPDYIAPSSGDHVSGPYPAPNSGDFSSPYLSPHSGDYSNSFSGPFQSHGTSFSNGVNRYSPVQIDRQNPYAVDPRLLAQPANSSGRSGFDNGYQPRIASGPPDVHDILNGYAYSQDWQSHQSSYQPQEEKRYTQNGVSQATDSDHDAPSPVYNSGIRHSTDEGNGPTSILLPFGSTTLVGPNTAQTGYKPSHGPSGADSLHEISSFEDQNQPDTDARLFGADQQGPEVSTAPEPRFNRLLFDSHDGARNGCTQPSWTPLSPDDTLPTDDDSRKAIVLLLKIGMDDRHKTLDNPGTRFDARWGNGKSPYPEKDIEKVCWDILSLAERIHTIGPSVVSLYDDDFHEKFAMTSSMTFGVRMNHIIELVTSFKSRVDRIMKGGALEMCVAIPDDKLKWSGKNKNSNMRKTKLIAKGRKAQAAGGETIPSALLDANLATPAAPKKRGRKPKSGAAQKATVDAAAARVEDVGNKKSLAVIQGGQPGASFAQYQHAGADVRGTRLASGLHSSSSAVRGPTGHTPYGEPLSNVHSGSHASELSMASFQTGSIEPASSGSIPQRSMADSFTTNVASLAGLKALPDSVPDDGNSSNHGTPPSILGLPSQGKRGREGDDDNATRELLDASGISSARPIKRPRKTSPSLPKTGGDSVHELN